MYAQTGGGVREVRRTPFFLSEYLQLSLEEVMHRFPHVVVFDVCVCVWGGGDFQLSKQLFK